jgi:molybdate transport system permease protein
MGGLPTDIWQPVRLTIELAAITTIILLIVGTPIAWWLARSKAWWKEAVATLVAMPLVLPPTVLGFYLLVMLDPNGPGGLIAGLWGGQTLAFTFEGLIIGSVLYSMPFVVQPIRNAFAAIGDRPLEVAATLRASPGRAFWTVAVPLARPGFLTGAVLGFAHTVGEFGVVLMIGGCERRHEWRGPHSLTGNGENAGIDERRAGLVHGSLPFPASKSLRRR